MREYLLGSFSLIHNNFGAVKPGKIAFFVIECAFSFPTLSSISLHCSPVRTSFHKIAFPSSFRSLSNNTKLCICPETPIPLICSGVISCSHIWCNASHTASHHNVGFCSDHPTCLTSK